MENTDGHHKGSIAKECFLADFSYTEILAFLSLYHGIELLLRQFHRNLRNLGMFCRKISDYINTVTQSKQNLTHPVPVIDTE